MPQNTRIAKHTGFYETLQKKLPGQIYYEEELSHTHIHNTTIAENRNVQALVKILTRDDIRECLKLANDYNIPLYPFSTGNNWGYGSSLPTTSDCVLLDLSSLNQIISVNEELAFAVVEPGVTQQQLHDYLQEHDISLKIDPTGAGPNCSILGNTLERGYGLSTYGDHFGHQCGMEVMLANGDIIHTGFGQFQNAQATYTYPYGVGPSLDGIFTQSNLGIVLSLGVWLQPIPKHFRAVYFSCPNEEHIKSLIDTSRELLLHEVILAGINILSQKRALMAQCQFPFESQPHGSALRPELTAKLASHIGTWNGITSLYAYSESQLEAAVATVKEAYQPYVKSIEFISEEDLERSPQYRESFKLLRGAPTEAFLKLAYWRNKNQPPVENQLHPARDQCGLIWIAPIIPLTGDDIQNYIENVSPIFEYFDFDFAPTFTTINSRSVACTQPILYDQQNFEETSRAKACYDTLTKELLRIGYVPYRLGIQAQSKYSSNETPYWQTVSKIKSALDPNQILSPRRYCPNPTPTT